jgi:hypothetical protein
MGYEANEGSLKPRNHIYAINYYSSVHARVIYLYQGPFTRVYVTRTDNEPTRI